MDFVNVGNPIPAIAQLGDGATNKYVRAWIYDNLGNQLTGSPLNLTHIANGLYWNKGINMPEVPYILVQCQAFDDSSYTVPSDSYIADRVYGSKVAEGGGLNIHDPIPVSAQLGDGSNDKFVRGWVYDDTGALVSPTPVLLSLVSNGLYNNTSVLMPDSTFVIVQVQAFDDAGFTTPSDDYITAATFCIAVVASDNLPLCPELTLSVASFKSYFFRDFPYGNTIDKVMDADIQKAIIQATCYLSRDLFCTEGSYVQGILLLAAHYLVMNLRASSQGVSGTFAWMQTSKSVGSVSEALQIPQRILDNPEFAMLTKTYYGAQLLFQILPQLSGQIFNVYGRTLP